MLEHGDRVLVTGAAGFIGSAVTRALLEEGASVVALLEPGADQRNLDGLNVERLVCDIRDKRGVRSAVSGCRAVFHVAALYRFWAPDPEDFYDVNVGGTRNVLEAAADTGVDRVVYTSTVGVLGVERAGDEPADETAYADISHLFGWYKRSKYVAEHEVLRAGAEGLNVSLVLPTFPLGPGDRAPTPTGRVVLDFLDGRMPAYVDTVLNVVHVDDVARGHLLALEKGATGRSYIFGGENVQLDRLLQQLSAMTGLPAPKLRAPRFASLGAAWASEVLEGRMLRRQPTVPLEAAKMSTTKMAFDDSRARKELGYSPRSASDALAASVRWFVEGGFVRPERRARIRLES